ncbi:MAG TPA: hypothetical protein DEP84_06525 [Chloroflexi bacterium]|nr:hypothetical protein [Chloroflexota bacterium]
MVMVLKRGLRIALSVLLPSLVLVTLASRSASSAPNRVSEEWAYRPLAVLNGADGGDYADFNGDGTRDMCVAAEEGKQAVCYLLDATTGTVTRALELGTFSPPGPEDVAIGDLTKDGRPDLAYFRQGSNQVGFISCGDNGDTSTCRQVPFGGVIHPVHNGFIADVDRDGNQDIVYAASQWKQSTVPGQEVAWFENPYPTDPMKSTNWVRHVIRQSDSEAESAWGFPGTGEYNQLDFVDLFKNGTRYLIVSERLANRISFYSTADPTVAWERVPIRVRGTGDNQPKHMTAQDVDGDGDIDLAVVLQQGPILVWENVGSPGALSFIQHEIDRIDDRGGIISPMGIGFHDLDGDGRFELVVNEYGEVPQTNVYIYTMNTISNWTRSVTIPVMYAGDDIFFDDINNDGMRDILSTWASPDSGQVYALLQGIAYRFQLWVPLLLKR